MTDKILLLSAVLLFTLSSVFAQEISSEADAADGESGTGTPAETENEEEESREDTRKLTLQYGIDSEVLSVLGDLRSEGIDTYNELLMEVLADSRNGTIDKEIYILWSATEWDGGLDIAAAELTGVLEDEDYEIDVVQSAISYLSERGYSKALPELTELSSGRNTKLAASAVRAIGKIGLPSAESTEGDAAALEGTIGETLLERLKKEDPTAEDDLVASIIVTLGILEYEPAADELVATMEDEGASAGHRRLSCISIGQIGRDEDYELVERLYYESSDATLRSYALAGLAEYDNRDTSGILIQALKRDSFWRIRLTAAEKLGDLGISDAAELLRYKAEYDPVGHVKIASMKALGKIGDDTSREFLLDYYTDEKKATDVRLAALSVLVENHLQGTNDAVLTVMDSLWEEDEGRFLEFTCRDLSRSEWASLSPVYERMLGHENWLLQVYGIRGIRKNSLSGLYGKVDALDVEGVDGKVRREITNGQ